MTSRYSMKIADDIYYRVLDLATTLVNASESFDKEVYRAQYNELREVCESEAASGRAHPLLFETLADFTEDDQIAIELYQKGLEFAVHSDAAAYRASIQFAIAQRYRNMGKTPLAYEYGLRASEAAKHLDDADLRQEIRDFLLNESKNA
jgi:hypothetical protein